MKKMIYAVKRGRKTGIFNEWLKCSEQTNKYSNSKFCRFEYRSELEEGPEDMPGSLRYAIKEAEEFLGDLVYLGESADYLEDVSWEKYGFLPFGDESEANDPELFSDVEGLEEEDIEDDEEEFGKWISANREKDSELTEYWAIAADMKKCVGLIRCGCSDTERGIAANRLRRQLKQCLSDVALSELTAIYKDLEEENAIGYNPHAVARFVERLANRYPKPEVIETEEVEEEAEDEVSMQQLLMQVGAIETELRGRILGQDAAIDKLSEAYFNTELKTLLTPNRGGPRSAYLLAGPPGVGKTYMAQQFAFRLGLPYKRFDMSGYSNREAIQELVGFAPTWKNSEPGMLTEFVSENPRCVLLFDEIEKAHISVIRMFLQILDDGICEDKHNRQNLSFKDAIIFFTTNAGKQLYSDAQTENLTLLPDKVVMDALEKDKDSETKAPFFPPEILSRMSSHTIIMFNYLKADAILELVKDDIEGRFRKLKDKCGYVLSRGKEYLARTVLYSMGGSADARNASEIAGKLVDREIRKFLELLEDKQILDEDDVERRIEWKCDFEDTTEEIRDFYKGERNCVIPVFGTVKYKSVGMIKNNDVSVKSTVNINEFMEMIYKENVLFAVIDYIHGLENVENRLNVVDARTIGRKVFLQLREEDQEVPVYILDGSRGHDYTDKEKNALMKKGAAGFIEGKYFRSQLEQAYKDVCCQVVMETLATRHQVLVYETKHEFDKDTNVGSIIFGDFKLETAVESEDKSSMLSDDLRPDKSWDDIYLPKHLEHLKEELKFFIDYLRKPKEYNKSGVRPRGVLLYGPPGTGKTSLAKVVASESKVNFLSISASELLNGGSEKVQDEFRIARKYAPAILFIDEIDAIGMKREYSNAPNPVLNALLTEMDGFRKVDSKPVFVMAATNLGNKIDFALQRRFDMTFMMDYLDKEGNLKLLEKLIKKQSDRFKVSKGKMESIAERFEGGSPAKLEQVVEAALREGIRSGCDIDDDLFDEVFEKCIMGEERVDRSPKEIERTAYHEAGHALVDLYNGRPPAYMSIVARGDHGGYMLPKAGERDSTKKYYLERICCILGGRAAEMVYADVLEIQDGLTHGPAADLEMATSIAANMVCKYGMYEEEIGLAVIVKIGEIELKYDEKVKELINRILSEQLKEAIRIIEANKDAMERLVNGVMTNEKKYLAKDEIQKTAGELNKK